MIKIYNTLSQKYEELVLGEEVKIYLCGPTVYNFIHIGNARPFVFFDVVSRYLSLKHKVVFIQNFTDIDDKIINKAKEEGVHISEISERYIEEYFKDADALNVRRADIYPKATDYVQQMVDAVQELLEHKIGYVADDGIYFDTSKYSDYGKLSKRDVINDENSDFALWKFEQNENISWPAPFGRGRPGWHIECSTMINSTVGSVDIHAGGQDLIFPHHENEIAQHESVKNTELSRYWMHNSFVQLNDKKMSKSEGNIVRVRELLETYSGNVIRFFLLSTHYRKPISLSDDALVNASKGFGKIEDFLSTHYILYEGDDFSEGITKLENSFKNFMDNDFNTQGLFGAILETIREFNKIDVSQAGFFELKKTILNIMSTLGFRINDSYDPEVDSLLRKRIELRDSFSYLEADKIRDQLLARGIEVKDGKKIAWKRVH